MNKIVSKEQLSSCVYKLEIEAPIVAKAQKPGNFVILRIKEKGERVPFTIVESNPTKGTITIVIRNMGVTRTKLCNLNVGDEIKDILGPLGRRSEISNKGTFLACGNGIRIAALLPIARAMKEAGNKVITIVSAKTKDLLILEDEMREISDEIHVLTEDGTHGEKGNFTDPMRKVIEKENIDYCIAIGPVDMMRDCANVTKEYNIPTRASLYSIMVDGTGMCGACRVSVNGKTKFTCVDGPEFDAHAIDFDGLLLRINGYKNEESKKLQHLK